jgi:hypothetical protein
VIRNQQARETCALARAAGKWPSEVLNRPLGNYVLDRSLYYAAKKEWMEDVQKNMPRGQDKSFGVQYVVYLLTKLVEGP